MVVQHNLTAMNSNRMLGLTKSTQAKSTEKLSSGYKINRAADDAAGLSISEKMRKQMRGLTQASANAQDGISSVQTAEGALTEVHDMLQRMNELAVKASNGTMSENDRSYIQAEVAQLETEINRVSETTKFNETYLLKGDPSGEKKTMTLEAHDAGIAGKLDTTSDVSGKTATFSLDKLTQGAKINIAGKEYTIDENKSGSLSVKSQSNLDTVTADNVYTFNGTNWVDKNSGTVDIAAKGLDVKDAEMGDKIEISAAKTYKDLSANLAATVTISGTDYTGQQLLDAKAVDGDRDLVYYDEAAAAEAGFGATGAQGWYNGQTKITNLEEDYGITINGSSAENGDRIHISQSQNAGLDSDNNTVPAKAAGGFGISMAGNDDATKAVAQGKMNKYAGYEFTYHKGSEANGAKAYWTIKDTQGNVSETSKGATSNGATALDAYGIALDPNATALDYDALDGKSFKITNDYKPATAEFFDKNTAADSTLHTTAKYVDAKVAAEGTITATQAYEKIQNELKVANDIGADVASEVSKVDLSDEKAAKFTITLGTAEVKKELSMNLHVGADADMTNKIGIDVHTMDATYLGIKGINVKDDSGMAATYAIDAITDAIQKVSTQRSALGAVQNRLEHTINNLDNVVENTTAAESAIRDTDMATEMVKYSNNNILAQAGQAMLAQANQSNQGVLSLLG